MYKSIASRLTAHFQVDGSHLNRYLNRRAIIQRALFEEIVLHDQVLIPTPDFLTADGLILILGERAFLDLLECDRLKFIRTRSNLGFVRGSGKEGGLAVFGDPQKRKPQDAEIDESVHLGLNVIAGHLTDRKKIEDLLIERSINIEMTEILEAVRREAISDFRKSSTWRQRFDFPNRDLLILPKMKRMQVKVMGMDPDPLGNPVDALLSLAMYNADFYLGNKFDCISASPFFPIGDVLRIKALRATGHPDALWNLFELNSVPDLSGIDLSDYENFKILHKVTLGSNASSFRKWFHALDGWGEGDVLKEYLSLLQEIPWTQKMPTRVFRFIATTALGVVPGVGQVASFIDAFVFDRVFRKTSPKFFIDDLRQLGKTNGLRN